MPDEGKHIVMLIRQDALYNLCIVEEVAVEQKNFLPFSLGTRQPEGIDVVGRLVILVVDEADIDAVVISLTNEVLDLLVQIACHDDKLADAITDEGIHRALQQCALAYFEEALRRVERERTKTRGSARSKNNGFHWSFSRLVV